MKNYLLLTTLILLFVYEVRTQTETCSQNLNNTDNRIISQIIDGDTIIREYILKIPINYDENVSTPIIVNLHGFGDCASQYSETIGDFYNFSQLANQENIILVYPQGAYRPEKGDTYWEPGDNGIENIYSNDVFFIDELISILQSEYNIDENMIYACGYSNGGMMAYSLACNRSNLFSAIGIMSGTMLQEDCTLDRAVPIIKFHGIADEVLPYNGNFWYQSVNEIVTFWLAQNNISSNTLHSLQLNNGNVILDQYSGGNNNSCMHIYTINEEFDKPGGHVWFSEEIEDTLPNNIMWNFFKDNCSTVTSANKVNVIPIRIFPNPVKHQLEINNENDKEYRINDINGTLIMSGKVLFQMETINVEYLKYGYYTLSIGNKIGKFLKID